MLTDDAELKNSLINNLCTVKYIVIITTLIHNPSNRRRVIFGLPVHKSVDKCEHLFVTLRNAISACSIKSIDS